MALDHPGGFQMTIAQQIGQRAELFDTLQRHSDFISLAKILMLARGRVAAARDLAASAPNVSARVRAILNSPDAGMLFGRAVVSPLTLVDNTAFQEYRLALAGFANALGHIGIFDRIYANGARRIPLATLTVGTSTVAITGAVVSEASAKPVSSISLTSSTVSPKKATGLCVVSAELLKMT